MRVDLNIALIALMVLVSIFLVGVAVALAGPYDNANLMYGAPGIGQSSSASSQPFTFEGKVVSVDPENNALTVEAIDKSMTSVNILEGKVSLGTEPNTKVMMCSYDTSLGNIKTGERVNITYHGEIGSLVADDIRAKC